jgi:hypothetical protein
LIPGVAAAASVEVKVDVRLELVAARFRLAGAKEYSGASESPYMKELAAWLAGVREHEAVAATRRLREKHGIGFDAPMQLALYLDPTTLRPLRPLAPRPPGLDERWEGVDVEAYVASLARFAEASRFRVFFAGQAARFAKVEARFKALAEKHDLRPWLDATYGARAGARSVVVPGMQTAGMNFGITVAPPGGGEVLYQVLMLENVDGEGLPRPGDATLSLWAHEASHPYVNPLVEASWPLLKEGVSAAYGVVAPQMRRQAYPDPKIVACESLVRAEVIRFLRARLGDKAARLAARDDDGRGFVWIDELVAALDASGDPLPRAMPAVVALFERWGGRARAGGFGRKPFRGPINAVYGSGLRSVVYATAAVQAYAGEIAAKLGRSEAPRAAEGAAWRDVEPGVDAVAVYGAPASTPLVAEVLEAHGERVTEEVIEVGGQRFATEGGAPQLLIVAHPMPGRAQGGVVLYTAARDEWVIGANNVFHGPTDWVVARRVGGKWQTVATGNF